jgi:hypothetical protein
MSELAHARALEGHLTVRYRLGMCAAFCLSCLVLVLLYAYSRIQLIDDAFIFLRYAHNIARGYGYVYNIGAPVEGATSISWTLVLAAIDWGGLPLERATEALSFGLELAIVALIWLKLYRDRWSLAATVVGLAALILSASWRLSIMMGLETGLYALLLTGLLVVLLWSSTYRLHWRLAGLIGALLLLTRPESVLTLGLVAIWLLRYHFAPDRRPTALRIMLIWALALLLITSWRLAIFGEIVPNSVIAKSLPFQSYADPAIIWPRVRAGFDYVLIWASEVWWALALAAVGLLSLLRTKPAQALLFMALLLPTLAVAVLNAGDWMPFSRLLTPLMPLVALLSAAAVQALQDSWVLHGRRSVSDAQADRAGRSRVGQTIVAALAMSASLVACVVAIATHDSRSIFEQPPGRFVTCYSAIGAALAPALAADTLIAPEGIGRIGYVLPDTRIFDFFGLVEPYIAHHGQLPTPAFTFGKQDYAYTMEQQPDLFIFHTDFHFGPLNEVGLAQRYHSFRLVGLPCEMRVAIANQSLDRFLPLLRQAFVIEPINLAQAHRPVHL